MKAVASNVKFVLHLIAMVFRGERHKARRKVLRKYYNLLRRYYRRYPSQGIRVLDEEWDYLIILDACRYDHFVQMNTLEGQLEKKISRASNTNEWLRKNFTGYYDDIVYVSGNPRCSDFELSGFKGSDHFYK
ncbi:MAG: hypothetical protein R3264_13140, partial [Anaerolineae bacterium]|nr:hypothetical protein [Anaerolineae bacterium]